MDWREIGKRLLSPEEWTVNTVMGLLLGFILTIGTTVGVVFRKRIRRVIRRVIVKRRSRVLRQLLQSRDAAFHMANELARLKAREASLVAEVDGAKRDLPGIVQASRAEASGPLQAKNLELEAAVSRLTAENRDLNERVRALAGSSPKLLEIVLVAERSGISRLGDQTKGFKGFRIGFLVGARNVAKHIMEQGFVRLESGRSESCTAVHMNACSAPWVMNTPDCGESIGFMLDGPFPPSPFVAALDQVTLHFGDRPTEDQLLRITWGCGGVEPGVHEIIISAEAAAEVYDRLSNQMPTSDAQLEDLTQITKATQLGIEVLRN